LWGSSRKTLVSATTQVTGSVSAPLRYAGLARAAIGTDTGGSVRSPAAYCGVVGLKPTRGRVPSDGVFPLSPTLDHVGTLAASVAEAALVLDAIADPGANPGAEPAAARPGRDLAGLRIAYARDWFAADPALMPGVLEEIDAAVSQLSLLGARITEVALPDYALFEAAGSVILDAEAFVVHRATLASDPAAYGRAAFASLLPGACLDAADLALAPRRRPPPPPARRGGLRPPRRARRRDDAHHRAPSRALPRGARRLDPDADAAVQRHRPSGAVGSRRLRRRAAGRAAARRTLRRRGARLPDRPCLRALDRPRSTAPARPPPGLRADPGRPRRVIHPP
jgi:Asp-tRNA(Asn)/Glu-tRNA(Gln) amidotransferase A subunit family amidase